ncbi:hypothetical protein ACKA06_10610 [Rossellomorea oryzaecorticis]|uniref:Uncharacterized protein n=1 Tax=Rossellomorea oryzaecorticis TaxID=1396505 RepID=A0ABW8VUL8_9BACI
MNKKEFGIIKNKESYCFTFIGFESRNAYGEVYIKDKNSTTYAFRGYGRQKVFKEAKKQMILIKLL